MFVKCTTETLHIVSMTTYVEEIFNNLKLLPPLTLLKPLKPPKSANNMNNNKYSSHVPRGDFLFNKLWKQTFFPPCLPPFYNGWLLPLNMLIINVVWKYNKLRKQTFLFATSLECLEASLWLLSQYKNLACLLTNLPPNLLQSVFPKLEFLMYAFAMPAIQPIELLSRLCL